MNSAVLRKPSDKAADTVQGEISALTFRISAAAILLVGALLRLVYLPLVPLHHDEGVNGNFLVSLVRSGAYTYDPNNYHGPTLYYFSAIFGWLARFFGGEEARDAYGLTTFNVRFVTAAFGVATIGLALLLRKRLGAIGALSAAALIAISPGAVYLSRYFIHESLFVFFMFGIVVAAVKYYDTGAGVYLILAAISASLMTATKETWIINASVLLIALITGVLYSWFRQPSQPQSDEISDPGRSILGLTGNLASALGYAISILAITNLLLRRENRFIRFHAFQSLLLQLIFVCAESALIAFRIIPGLVGMQVETVTVLTRASAIASIIVLVLYLAILILVAVRAFHGETSQLPLIGKKAHEYASYLVLARFGGPVSVATVALVAFTVFIVVNVLFYSSFFKNYPKGVSDALQTLALWRKRTHEHAHPWHQYIRWLIYEEGIILMLGGLGALIALWRANNRFALFVAQWAFGLLAAYSLVGYKTPWIALNFIVPLALTSGYTLDVFYRKLREFNQRLLFLAPAVLIVAFCGFQMWQLNFRHYDNDRYVYVYAHTRREMLVMLEQVEQVADRIAKMDRTGKLTRYDTGVAIVSPEYWPLPWYFRDYKRVGYYQKAVATTEPIIIGCLSCIEPGDSIPQKEKLDEMYGAEYQQIDSSKLGDLRILADRNPDGSFTLRPGVDLVLYVRRDMVK